MRRAFFEMVKISSFVASLWSRSTKVVEYKIEAFCFMEGFWTVQFTGVQGWGAGVLTLIGGRLFGGDSGFLYTGTYTEQGNALTARVHVKRYVAGIANVMG